MYARYLVQSKKYMSYFVCYVRELLINNPIFDWGNK